MEKENPSYYCVIPADVRYDSRLNANEKLMYGEITALSNKSGECWASNSYFAKLYGKSINSISSWINKLKKLGYIDVKMVSSEGKKNIEKRIITITRQNDVKNSDAPVKENLDSYPEYLDRPIQKKYSF